MESTFVDKFTVQVATVARVALHHIHIHMHVFKISIRATTFLTVEVESDTCVLPFHDVRQPQEHMVCSQ